MDKLKLSLDDNNGLADLLFLDGCIIAQDHGCWVKIEAQQAKRKSLQRPHGIRYSLSLHARDGTRLLGYDNAHPIRKRKAKHSIRYTAYDHKHIRSGCVIEPYQFVSAQQLMTDFWNDVDKSLERYAEKIK